MIWTRSIDLSERELDIHEKLFVVEMFYKDKENDCILSIRSFSLMHGLSKSTFEDWKKHFDEYKLTGMLKMSHKRGRPPYLDYCATEEVKRRLNLLVKTQKTPGTEEFAGLLQRGITETKQRKGAFVGCPTISKEFVRVFRKANEVSVCKRQFKTKARIDAESDPRNAFSMIAMVSAFCQQLHNNMIFNWDATQFYVEDSPEGTGLLIRAELPTNQAATSESGGGLGFSIKLYHLHNADGYCAPPVFVIADESMDSEELAVHKVIGLSSNQQ
jgi:hypothetical protein